MSEPDAGYLPHIPYSRLKELKYHAEMVVIAVGQGSFKGSDLWRIYVGLEVNSLLASYWYEQFEALKKNVEETQTTTDSRTGTESQGSSQ